jgi:pimeloyl-[acyl-carrier protein] methyl ester esterase
VRIVLLPGMDGTGLLYRDFVRHAPAGFETDVVRLPDEPLPYAELARRMAPTLTPGCVVVAESFSGPIGIRLARMAPIGALVLCNTFVAPPLPSILRFLAIPLLFRAPVPAAAVRRWMAGPDAPDELVARIREAIASVPPALLASRLRSVLTADETDALAGCAAPVLHLRGVDDRLVRERGARGIAGSPRVTVARIPGPHLLLQAEPVAAWSAIVRFLSSPRVDA